MSDKTRQRWVLILLVLIFAAPMGVSSFLYFFTDAGRGGAGHGELIEPPRPLPDLALTDAAGAAGHLHGKWTLLAAIDGRCETACEKYLYMLRQLRFAQSTNQHRVQRVLVVDTAPEHVLSAAQREAYPGQWLLDARTPGAAIIPADGAVYLSDPLGNLIMRYPAGTPPDGILRDLKRLLRYSRIG